VTNCPSALIEAVLAPAGRSVCDRGEKPRRPVEGQQMSGPAGAGRVRVPEGNEMTVGTDRGFHNAPDTSAEVGVIENSKSPIRS